MRAKAHYVAAVAVMSLYGGKVCPLVDRLDLVRWTGLLAVIFGATFWARYFLDRLARARFAYETQTKAQFFLEWGLFAVAGAGIAVYNDVAHDFSLLSSGGKMLRGCLTLGFFAAVDLALEREREILTLVARTGQDIDIRERHFPLTAKFALVSSFSIVFMANAVFLMLAKDLRWIVDMGAEGLEEARRAVMVELIYVGSVILAHIINMIVSYSRNLKIFFEYQNSALTAVAGGDLESRVPVGTNDEFGIMARYTNKMIRDLDARNKALWETQLEVVKRLGRAAEYRDNETGLHVVRMSLFSAQLAKAAGMSPEDCELLLYASPMHDIGKIGIPDRVLLKPGKLDDDEWEIMKTHAMIGGGILGGGQSRLMQMAETIALTHQEKWDGSGYPRGLRGEEIPLAGRIAAICDVFDALTSERPYKKAWTVEKAVELIEQGSGQHFDPRLVELFKQILPEILRIQEQYKEPAAHHNDGPSAALKNVAS